MQGKMKNVKTPVKSGVSAGEKLGHIYCTFTALICKCLIMNGAGEGNRTLVSALGRPHSTIEPHPLRFRSAELRRGKLA